MIKGKCKLCLEENVDLLTKSHIIPKFLFEDMKDDFNSFVQIEPNNFIYGRNQHVKKQRDSFHEKNILCKNCDGIIIKKYEDYLKLTFHSTAKPVSRPCCVNEFKTKEGLTIYNVENIDYTLYKLGFLSILWRASISSLPFFKIIDLGPHSEIIRKMILNGNALEINIYPFITSLFNRKNDTYQVILPIEKIKANGFFNYRFIINGLDILFMVGSENINLNKDLIDFVPNKTNKLKLIIHKENYAKEKLEAIIYKDKKKRPIY